VKAKVGRWLDIRNMLHSSVANSFLHRINE
jgi:hypothetical protein